MGEAKAKATGEREAREVPRDRDRTDDGQVLQARRQGGDGGGQARAEEEVGGTPARFALSLSLDLDARNSISSLPSPLRPSFDRFFGSFASSQFPIDLPTSFVVYTHHHHI